MPRFRVLIHVDSISIPGEGRPLVGFFTTRIVTASDEQGAQVAAADVVRAELQTEHPGPGTAAPHIVVEECERLGYLQGLFARGTGRAFYPSADS